MATMEAPLNRPTAPTSVRNIVNDFINDKELLGYRALLFRMDYVVEDESYEDGVLTLTEYCYYNEPTNTAHDLSDLRPRDAGIRRGLERPVLLRISEERLPPLGIWLWNFRDDTLLNMGY